MWSVVWLQIEGNVAIDARRSLPHFLPRYHAEARRGREFVGSRVLRAHLHYRGTDQSGWNPFAWFCLSPLPLRPALRSTGTMDAFRMSMPRPSWKDYSAILSQENGSLPDIFVDNRDAWRISVVVEDGEWETVANPWRAYGPDYLSDRYEPARLPKSVRYVPGDGVGRAVQTYTCTFLKYRAALPCFLYAVYDGKESSRTCIRAGEIVVTGRTGGEWVRVGRYRFSAGNRGYVEVSNKGADGTVVRRCRLVGSCRFGRSVGSGCACGGVSARAVRVRHAESRSVPKRVLLAVADGKHPLSIRGERVCDAPCCRFLRYRASLRLERSYEPMISRIGRSWPR